MIRPGTYGRPARPRRAADRCPTVTAATLPDRVPADGSPPLADLRVIDMATVLAGPGCARYLADFGADVIKVERPGVGDGTRAMGWRDPADDVTLFWKLVGRGKRCITLDLKDPAGPRRAAPPERPLPTCSSRTSGPASSRRSGWCPTTSSRPTRA